MKAGKERIQSQRVIEKANEMKGVWGEESLEPVMCGKSHHRQSNKAGISVSWMGAEPLL